MKMTLFKMMMCISTMINSVKTPMTMGILLLLQTAISTVLISKSMDSSWIAMIMFLMLIGGLLILFMYMSSIASNEKFTPNLSLILVMILFLMMPYEEMISEFQINENEYLYSKSNSIAMTKLYNKKTMMITLVMFLYLFLTMIVVTMVVKIYKGPLRSK